MNQALKMKRKEFDRSNDKITLMHDDCRPHMAQTVTAYLETLSWEVLIHPPHSPDISPTNYHLFRTMTHAMSDQQFHSVPEVKNWIDSWIENTDEPFFRRGIHSLPGRWEQVIASNGHYFE